MKPDDEFRSDVWQAIDSSLGHGDEGRRFAVESIIEAAERWNRRTPAAPPEPLRCSLCGHPGHFGQCSRDEKNPCFCPRAATPGTAPAGTFEAYQAKRDELSKHRGECRRGCGEPDRFPAACDVGERLYQETRQALAASRAGPAPTPPAHDHGGTFSLCPVPGCDRRTPPSGGFVASDFDGIQSAIDDACGTGAGTPRGNP